MGFWNKNKNAEQDKSDIESSNLNVTTIDFGEVLDISFAAKLYSQLKDEIEKNSTVSFITSKLTRIDTSYLQVLASFMVYAKESDIKVEWPEVNEVLKEAVRLTCLSEIIEELRDKKSVFSREIF